MQDNALKQQLSDLLVVTGKAHHEAFEATDGADPDWPIWYARHLRDPLNKMLETELTSSRLVYCIMDAEYERSALAPDADWPGYYADHFLECFAPSATAAEDRLALYHFHGCSFCSLVTATIDRLGLDVELRDIYADRANREALIAARGRSTVPVLRITAPDGEDRWMPESRDIVEYLEKAYAGPDIS